MAKPDDDDLNDNLAVARLTAEIIRLICQPGQSPRVAGTALVTALEMLYNAAGKNPTTPFAQSLRELADACEKDDRERNRYRN